MVRLGDFVPPGRMVPRNVENRIDGRDRVGAFQDQQHHAQRRGKNPFLLIYE